MSESTGSHYPALCPYLYYEDTPAAMDWLGRAFGFRERLRVTDDDGLVQHAEMELGAAVIMLGSPPGYQSAAHLGQVTSSVYVRVDDVDAHYRQAVAAGAGVLREPTDQDYGERNYGVTDAEGQHWWFAAALS
jgi:PhnB protein